MKCIVEGIATEYAVSGKGPIIMLLHGWGTSSRDMENLARELANSYCVITLDFPGFGSSERPAEVWGVGDYATFVQKFLEKINISDIYALIGHSFGGRVIIAGCARNIIKPNKIVLIGSAGIKHSADMKTTVFKGLAKSGKALLSLPGLSKYSSRAKLKLYEKAGSMDYLEAGGMKDIFSKVIHEDLQSDAAEIVQSTLLIWGSKDEASPVADAKQFHKLITHSHLEIIEGAGHFVHHDETTKVQMLIKRFLDA